MDQATEKHKFLDVRNAANRLNCTPAHVYTLIKDGRLKAINIGERKGIRIDEKDISDFLASREVKPEEYYQ